MSMDSTSFVDDTAARRHSMAVGGAHGVQGASRKIGKPPARQRKPVVINVVCPRIIHVEAGEFMPLVQRLTGPEESSAGGDAENTAAPVRVDARALDCRQCPAPAVSVAAKMRYSPPLELLFRDRSQLTLRGVASEGDGFLASPPAPSWLHNGGDRSLNPAEPAPASAASYMDIFGTLPTRQ